MKTGSVIELKNIYTVEPTNFKIDSYRICHCVTKSNQPQVKQKFRYFYNGAAHVPRALKITLFSLHRSRKDPGMASPGHEPPKIWVTFKFFP